MLLAAGSNFSASSSSVLDEAPADGAASVRDILLSGYQGWWKKRYATQVNSPLVIRRFWVQVPEGARRRHAHHDDFGASNSVGAQE